MALYTGIFFFFLTKHIFVFTSSRDLALEKRCVVKVTHFTRVFALTKESQRTGPRLLGFTDCKKWAVDSVKELGSEEHRRMPRKTDT